MFEPGKLVQMHNARIENPGDRDKGQRDHREQSENGRESRAELDFAIGGDEKQQNANDGNGQRRPGDEGVDRRETRRRVEAEAIGEIGGGEDHIEGRHRKPAQPIGPGGKAVDVLCEFWPARDEGRIGIAGRAAGALRHHRRKLRQEETKQPARERNEDRDRNRRSAE